MIEQQLFTKTEKGLTKNTPGYDTVAKSPGLENSYLTNYIHQYCRYFVPEQVFTNENKYPKIRTYAAMTNSDLVIGQTAHGAGDTYISHNYVVKKNTDQWEEFVKDIANLGYADFATTDEKGADATLPALEKLPYTREGLGLSGRAKCFAKNNISIPNFKKLLDSVFNAVEKRKKIFLSIKGAMAETSAEALEIMKYLYAALPYELRRRFGYSSFFYDGDVLSGVDLYFVYNGLMPDVGNVIQLGKHNCAKDYIFDFEHENFLHLETKDLEKSEFLNYIILHIDHLDKIQPFFDFAEKVSCHLPESQKTNLRLYDDLLLLYNMENMEQEDVLNYSGRLIISLGDLFAKGGANPDFIAVYEAFIEKYAAAIRASKTIISNDFLKRLVTQYENATGSTKEKIEAVLQSGVQICAAAGDFEQVFIYMNIINASEGLYKKLLVETMMQDDALFETYLQHLFNQKRTVHGLFDYAESLLANVPEMADSPVFRQLLYDKNLEFYTASADRYIALRYLESRCDLDAEKYPVLAQIYAEIYKEVFQLFIHGLSVTNFPVDHIMDFSIKPAQELDEEMSAKYNTVLALREILELTDDQTMAFVHYDAFGFDGLGEKISQNPELAKKAEREIRQRLWSDIAEKKSPSKRCVYPVLLYAAETNENGRNYDFERIFRFIETSLDTDAMDFINWFMTGNLYITPNEGSRLVIDMENTDTRVLERFYKSVLNYYRRSNGTNLRDSRYLKKLTQALNSSKNKHKDFKEVLDKFNEKFDEIVRQNTSPLSKLGDFLGRKYKQILLLVLAVAVVIAGVVLASHYISRNEEGTQSVQQGYVTPEPGAVKSLVKKNGWSANKVKKNGEAASCASLLKDDEVELFQLAIDEEITIDLGQPMKVNGLLFRFIDEPENLDSLMAVYVVENNRKIKVTETAFTEEGSVYEFSPMTIEKIILQGRADAGEIKIGAVNAYVYK